MCVFLPPPPTPHHQQYTGSCVSPVACQLPWGVLPCPGHWEPTLRRCTLISLLRGKGSTCWSRKDAPCGKQSGGPKGRPPPKACRFPPTEDPTKADFVVQFECFPLFGAGGDVVHVVVFICLFSFESCEITLRFPFVVIIAF